MAGWLYGNPFVRVLGAVLNGLVGGILTNWLLLSVTVAPGEVDWSRAPATLPAWLLTAFVAIACAYAYGLYRHDADILRWSDGDYRRAMVAKALFPKVVVALERRLDMQDVRSMNDIDRMLGL